MRKGTKDDIKKIKNILSDSKEKNNDFDVLFLIDATGSMSPYITAAKEESKNISEELRKLYPEMMFKYGYIFYRDPIDSEGDIHELIDLTDDVNSLPEKIGKIEATGGGDLPEDWVGAYKMANEKISWRNGNKVIIHLTDAGAHGKLFTKNDKYPNEEPKLIEELQKCALKKIKIFGYIINEECRNSFEECSKIYRSNGGSFEILDFISPEMKKMDPMMDYGKEKMIMNPMMMDGSKPPMAMGMGMNPSGGMMMGMNPMMMGMNSMNSMMNAPNPMMMGSMNPMMGAMNPMMNMSNQGMLNMNFRMNAINSISNSMGGIKKD